MPRALAQGPDGHGRLTAAPAHAPHAQGLACLRRALAHARLQRAVAQAERGLEAVFRIASGGQAVHEAVHARQSLGLVDHEARQGGCLPVIEALGPVQGFAARRAVVGVAREALDHGAHGQPALGRVQRVLFGQGAAEYGEAVGVGVIGGVVLREALAQPDRHLARIVGLDDVVDRFVAQHQAQPARLQRVAQQMRGIIAAPDHDVRPGRALQVDRRRDAPRRDGPEQVEIARDGDGQRLRRLWLQFKVRQHRVAEHLQIGQQSPPVHFGIRDQGEMRRARLYALGGRRERAGEPQEDGKQCAEHARDALTQASEVANDACVSRGDTRNGAGPRSGIGSGS